MQKELQKCGKIAIMGQDYTIYINTAENTDYYGLTKTDTKQIIISKQILDNIGSTMHVLKHEITHAMFYECGLMDYAADEALVDWIAYKGFVIEDKAEDIYNILGSSKHDVSK